jgi:peptide-methionine (S)-S-oxide reductase
MIATLAAGCFWCLEAVFKRLEGISNLKPGYSKGEKEDAIYEKVCSGNTKHVEAIQFEYDESKISFEEILKIYFKIHDPTTLNRQGNDMGEQYGAFVFYHNDKQKQIAKKIFEEQIKIYGSIATKLEVYKNFFEAEKNHHEFYDRNKNNPYCIFVIKPKLEKIKGLR